MIKNNLFIFSVLVLFASFLEARENPFEPTQTYQEEKTKLIKSLKQNKEIKKKPLPVDTITKVKKAVEEIIVTLPKIKQDDLNGTQKNVKPVEIKTYKYNLLPFVKIDIKNDIMNISTKYKLKKFFIVKKENKLVFDYIGKKRFYTKRETLSSHKDFNKIIIGAHPDRYYFRVVIQTKGKATDAKVNIDKKTNLVTISHM
jgi:hypothetical protein